MLSKVCEFSKINQGYRKEGYFYIYPIIKKNIKVSELFNMNNSVSKSMLLYVYIWHPDNEQFIKGILTYCYDILFTVKELAINDLERMDYLYTRNPIDELVHPDALGIVYKIN